MAIGNYVPSGQIGTGAAQILGPNVALQNWIGQTQRDADRLYNQQVSYQERIGQQNQQFTKYLRDLQSQPLPRAYNQDIQQLSNELVNRGAQLMTQGVNPWNPSGGPDQQAAANQFLQDERMLRNAVTRAKEVDDYKKKILEQLGKADPNSYDIDEFKSAMEIDKNISLQDLASGNFEFPTVSRRFNVTDIAKQYPNVSSEFSQYQVDEKGNPIRRQIKEADLPRIANIVNANFVGDTPYTQEVNRQLRKQFGSDANISGLFGTTDREQIKNLLDAEFRSPTENNPLVELRMQGKIKSFDDPNYEKFLNDATDEQLKAEKVLDDSKQLAANAIIGRVGTKDTFKFDWSQRNQQLKEEAAQRAEQSFVTTERNKAATYAKTQLGIAKLRQDISAGQEGVRNISDVTVKSDNGTNIVMAGATSGSTPEFEYNPTDKSYNIGTQEKDTNKREKAKLLGVGVVAIDKNTGRVYPGDPRDYIGSPNVSFEPRAQVRAITKKGGREKTEDYFEDPKVISNSLAGENKKFAQGSITTAEAVKKQFDAEHQKALQGPNPQPQTNTTKKPTKASSTTLSFFK